MKRYQGGNDIIKISGHISFRYLGESQKDCLELPPLNPASLHPPKNVQRNYKDLKRNLKESCKNMLIRILEESLKQYKAKY